MGNTETCTLTDWLSLITSWAPTVKRLLSGINQQTVQFLMQMNMCPCLCFFFFSLSWVHGISSSSIIHHVHNVYYWLLSLYLNLVSAALKIKPLSRFRCWKGWRRNSNHEWNHPYTKSHFFNLWHFKLTVSTLQTWVRCSSCSCWFWFIKKKMFDHGVDLSEV